MRYKLGLFIFVLVIAAYSEMHTFSLSLGSSYVLPLNLRDDWESFPVFGGGILCPSDNGSTTIGFSAFYGNLRSDSMNVAAHPILCTEINVTYRVLQLQNSFSVYAAAALINWSVKQADDVTLENISLIAAWENEFGAALGVSAGFQPFDNIVVSIPLRCSTVFSSPQYFCSFSFGLSVGYLIHLGKND